MSDLAKSQVSWPLRRASPYYSTLLHTDTPEPKGSPFQNKLVKDEGFHFQQTGAHGWGLLPARHLGKAPSCEVPCEDTAATTHTAAHSLGCTGDGTTPGISPQEIFREFTCQELDFGEWRDIQVNLNLKKQKTHV